MPKVLKIVDLHNGVIVNLIQKYGLTFFNYLINVLSNSN